MATTSKDAVAPLCPATFEPPLSAGAPPLRSVQPDCWNIHVAGAGVPSAHTFPYSTPPCSFRSNQYHCPTFQLNVQAFPQATPSFRNWMVFVLLWNTRL